MADITDPIIGAAMDKAADNDHDWFVKNPHETVRYREAFPMEFGGVLTEMHPELLEVEGKWWVEVKQVAPGLRVRAPYFVIDRGDK